MLPCADFLLLLPSVYCPRRSFLALSCQPRAYFDVPGGDKKAIGMACGSLRRERKTLSARGARARKRRSWLGSAPSRTGIAPTADDQNPARLPRMRQPAVDVVVTGIERQG
jgi:hypothetical protein